jgi:hypothetical protein
MDKFHDEIPVRKVFTAIFHIFLCKNQFRRNLTNYNLDFGNYCFVLIQNVQVSRRDFGSERSYSDFSKTYVEEL